MLACVNGHLDDFPYREFVHRGGACPEASHPALQMDDYGGNRGANVMIRCTRCPAKRNISQAMGRRGEESLPMCRGRHPHLGTFDKCDAKPIAIVVGASNNWFAQTLSTLAVPPTGASELQAKVAQLWEQLQHVRDRGILDAFWALSQFQVLHKWAKDEVFDAIEQHAKAAEAGGDREKEYPDLLTPEWDIFTATPPPEPTDDFTLRRGGVPGPLAGFVSDVVQAERLREVRALTGFTRLDAPDPQDPDLVKRAPLARDKPDLGTRERGPRGRHLPARRRLCACGWESQVADSEVVREHKEAFGRFRTNRYSGRINADFDAMYGWPGARYIALHTLTHLLIRTIALECGYSSASLSERIYSGPDRAGILIYTAVPDAEGTLGGLVSLAEPEPLTRIMHRARRDALRCSSDPLCAERLPAFPADFLHGAACHACLFVSETTCERGNRFLDRRFIVPVDPKFPPSSHDLGSTGEGRCRPAAHALARPRCEPRSSTRWRAGPGRRSCGSTPYSAALLDALAGVDRSAGLAYLTGLAAGYAQRAAEVSVETVWSGPGSHHVPVRATAAVLADVIREARRELLLMTYSARQYEPLTVALQAAVSRGVHVSVVVETLQGAGSALAGDEPYQAFTGIDSIDLWHWPSAKRTESGAKMHAKLAVADRCVLFVTSANLTQSGVGKNIEAGLLVRGGTTPLRAAEHVGALRAAGALSRLS